MDYRQENFKRQAAERAVERVTSGMVIGLGGGTTVCWATRSIGGLLRTGILHDISVIACSTHVEREAGRYDIPLSTLSDHPVVDLTIDGADQVCPSLDLIKGRGGALLREKIVAQASRYEIIVVDETKLSPLLGADCPVPVEVLPFGWRCQADYIITLGARVSLRTYPNGELWKTDQSNLILDCDFGQIHDLQSLACSLESRAGIVGHGLFIGCADEVVIAGPNGIHLLAHPVPGHDSVPAAHRQTTQRDNARSLIDRETAIGR